MSRAGLGGAARRVPVHDRPRGEPEGDRDEGDADRHQARSQEVVEADGKGDVPHPDEAFSDRLTCHPEARPVDVVVDHHGGLRCNGRDHRDTDGSGDERDDRRPERRPIGRPAEFLTERKQDAEHCC